MDKSNLIQKEFIKKNTISNEDKTKFLPKTNLVEEKKKERRVLSTQMVSSLISA